MKNQPIPFKRIIFVCTHSRENETACANLNRGDNSGLHLVEKLREEVKKRGLKSKIRICNQDAWMPVRKDLIL